MISNENIFYLTVPFSIIFSSCFYFLLLVWNPLQNIPVYSALSCPHGPPSTFLVMKCLSRRIQILPMLDHLLCLCLSEFLKHDGICLMICHAGNWFFFSFYLTAIFSVLIQNVLLPCCVLRSPFGRWVRVVPEASWLPLTLHGW